MDEARGGRGEKPFKRFETPKPVAVGDEVDVTIESVGGQGDGIAKVSGFVIFVKGAKKGEHIRVKVTDVKRTYAVGEKVGEASGQPEKKEEPDEEEGDEAEEEAATEGESESEEGESEEEEGDEGGAE